MIKKEIIPGRDALELFWDQAKSFSSFIIVPFFLIEELLPGVEIIPDANHQNLLVYKEYLYGNSHNPNTINFFNDFNKTYQNDEKNARLQLIIQFLRKAQINFLQFVDDEGKLHPFIIYTPDEDNLGEFDYNLAEHQYDEMVESMLQTRLASWEKTWHLINKKKDNINIYPERDENSAPIGIFVADASLEVKADLEIYFQLNLFESNRFWAKLSGGVSIDAPIHLRFGGKQLQKEKEIPVFEFTPVFTAFAVGPFVVPVVIRNGFIFKYSGAINANLSMMVPFYYKASFETGPKYESGRWGSFKGFEWHAGINYEKLTVVPSATLSLEAGAGFYFHTGAYLGGAVGPYFEFGPQAEVSANAALSGNEVYFNTNGNVSIGGEVGAEIKIWKFDLGKIKIPYKVVSKDLWDVDLRFNKDDIVNAMKPKQ
jgi:hypothetical protein